MFSSSRVRPALIVVVAMVGACRSKPPERVVTVPVQVSAAVRVSAPVVVSANGVVEPLQTVSVEAQVSGILTEVAFHEGDEVQPGQVLFRVDPRPFQQALRQAEATLARDQAQEANAKRDAERYRTLVEKDYVTKAQADQAEATAAALTATLEADRAAVENARLNLDYTTIRAPIAGRTGSLLVRQGNLVKANSGALVVINQIRPVLVRFPVTQLDFLALRRRAALGQVPVRATATDSTVVAETGVLSFIDNAVDSLTGTVTAKARFLNATRALWPGEYVRVTVELDVRSGAVAVPTSAVLNGQEGTYVYVVDADHNAQVRPVSRGQAVGDLTVIDKGIQPGERVVVDGQSRLAPGAKVDVKEMAHPVAERSDGGPTP
jgi:multidrug efflux system membrane fusion protein